MSGKDYPTFSLSSLGKKGNFKVRSLARNFYNNLFHQGIKPAPADKIPKDYPKNSINGGGGSRSQKKGSGGKLLSVININIHPQIRPIQEYE